MTSTSPVNRERLNDSETQTFIQYRGQSLYRDCLTVDAAQGQEEPIVIFLLSKPRPVAEEVRFIANKERLNVALSRAQKAVVVVGNARLWNTDAIKAMGARSKSLAFFCGILKSLTAPGTRRVLRNQAQFTATSSNAVPISMQMDVDSPAFDTFAAPTPRVRLPPVSRTRSRSRSRSPNANTAYRERSPHMSTMHSKVSYVNLWLEQKVKDLKGSLRRYEAVLEMVEAQAAADIAKAKLDVVQVRQQLAELLTKAQDEEMDLGD